MAGIFPESFKLGVVPGTFGGGTTPASFEAPTGAPSFEFGVGQGGDSPVEFAGSPIGIAMEMQRRATLAAAGLPLDADPSQMSFEEARGQNEDLIAKLATVNPEMAEQFKATLTGTPEEGKGLWDPLTDVVGEVVSGGLSVGGKILDIVTRPAQIIPELIVDPEGDPWYQNIAQAMSGKSKARGSDVLRQWGVENDVQAGVGGFVFDVLADPISWLTLGTTGLGRQAVTTGVKGLVGASFLKSTGVTDDIARQAMTRLTKQGIHPDVTGPIVAESIAGISRQTTSEALELSHRVMQAVQTNGLKALPEQLTLGTSGTVVPKTQIMGWLNEARKAGTGAARGSTEAGLARVAAGALGGFRPRAVVPFTQFRWYGPGLLEGNSMRPFGNFFRGQSGLNRMTHLINSAPTGSGGVRIPGTDRLASYDDYNTYLTEGLDGLRNPELAKYMGGGVLGLGSMMMPLSQQVGRITAHLTPGAATLRGGGLIGEFAREGRKAARSVESHFAETTAYQVFDRGNGTLLKNKDAFLGDLQKNLSRPEHMGDYRLFEDLVPLEGVEGAGGAREFLKAPEEHFQGQFEEVEELYNTGMIDFDEANKRLDVINNQVESIRELGTSLNDDELTSLMDLKMVWENMKNRANQYGVPIEDVTTPFENVGVGARSQVMDAVKTNHAQVRNKTYYYEAQGAEEATLMARGLSVDNMAVLGMDGDVPLGRGVRFKSAPPGEEIPEGAVEVGVRLRRPQVIDQREGKLTNQPELQDLWNKTEESLDNLRTKPEFISANPHLLNEAAWDNYKKSKLSEMWTEEVRATTDADGMVIIREDGLEEIVKFDTSGTWVVNDSAPYITENIGYFPRLTTDAFDEAITGIPGDNPRLYGTNRESLLHHRQTRGMDIDEAESFIKRRVLEEHNIDLGDIQVFERNILTAHDRYARRVSRAVKEEVLGRSAQRLALLGDQGIFPTGGAVSRATYEWAFPMDEKELARLSDTALTAWHKTMDTQKKAWEGQERQIAEVTEKVSALDAKLMEAEELGDIEKMVKVRGELRTQKQVLQTVKRQQGKMTESRDIFNAKTAGTKARSTPEYHRLRSNFMATVDEVNRTRSLFHTKAAPVQPALIRKERKLTGFRELRDIKGMEDFAMPAYIADEFESAVKMMGGTNEVRKAWRRWVMGPWKKAATIYFPGFHARNAMGAFFNNMIGGVSEMNYHDSFKIMKALKGNEKWTKGALRFVPKDKLRNWGLDTVFESDQVTWEQVGRMFLRDGVGSVNSRGVADIYTVADEMERAIEVGRQGGKVKKAASKAASVTKAGPVWQAYKSGAHTATTGIENYFRFSAMLKGLEMTGGDLAGARTFTMMRHGDYVDLTDFDQGVKDVIPFYKWMRTNMPFQIRNLLENPAMLSAPNKAAVAATEAQGIDYDEAMKALPDWMKGSFVVPTGDPDDVMTAWVLDLPYSDLYHGATEYLSSMLPVVRPFIENVVGKNFFTGADIEDEQTPLTPWLQPIAPVLDAMGLTERDTEGNATISAKMENIMSAIPLFSRSRNWIMGDPDRVKQRANTFTSAILGLGRRTIDQEELTDQEIGFYYGELLPAVDYLKSLGVTLPDKDMISESVYSYLDFEAPTTPA